MTVEGLSQWKNTFMVLIPVLGIVVVKIPGYAYDRGPHITLVYGANTTDSS